MNGTAEFEFPKCVQHNWTRQREIFKKLMSLYTLALLWELDHTDDTLKGKCIQSSKIIT